MKLNFVKTEKNTELIQARIPKTVFDKLDAYLTKHEIKWTEFVLAAANSVLTSEVDLKPRSEQPKRCKTVKRRA